MSHSLSFLHSSSEPTLPFDAMQQLPCLLPTPIADWIVIIIFTCPQWQQWIVPPSYIDRALSSSLIWFHTSFNISNNSSTTFIDSIRTIDDWEWHWRVGFHPINLFNMKHNAVGDAVSFDFESTFWCGLFDWISMLLKWIIIENTYTNGIVRFSTYI